MTRKEIVSFVSVIILVTGVTIWFLFSYVPQKMSSSYDILETLKPAEANALEKEPSYCVVKGSFLLPVMLVSGENKICQNKKVKKEKITIKETGIERISQENFACSLKTNEGKFNIDVGLYPENGYKICQNFKVGKEYELIYKEKDSEEIVYPINVK